MVFINGWTAPFFPRQIAFNLGFPMAFSDFLFPQVQRDLGLVFGEADLFDAAPPVVVRSEFQSQLELGAAVALSINTEKARSEFIIAPVLLELKRIEGGRLGLFSGVPLDGDSARGLNGVCDFVLTTSGLQLVMTAPLVAVVEAKNDNLMSGLGQCIAAMVAAELVNEREAHSGRTVYGVVTTGSAWKFLRLSGTAVTADRKEYYVDNVGKVLGILRQMVQGV
jgi:hypothetical protein